ncbi:hypothetical protein BCV02_05030 [Vibrio breoganii]|uniref:glycosyltransferase family 2 protein n=1 Tax=Vibrio breoganii TaxID=553239 RepID=UPI000C838C86|nr:glycosyltransferase [Vibrio breoganii]PMG05089.1 hypothetical protein BCV02_05030 [Vibrio breoganii]
MLSNAHNVRYSVVIPVYNAAEYIVEALSSLNNQVVGNYSVDVILVNDGSTDNIIEVVEKFRSDFEMPVELISQDNQGVSVARNTGLSVANGDYVLFLDADDTLSSDFFFNITREICGSDKNINLLITSYRKVNRNTIDYFINKNIENDEEVKYRFLNGSLYCNMCTFIFKRKCIENIGLRFTSNVKFGEDIEFYAKYLFSQNDIAMVPDSFFNYHFRFNSAMNAKPGVKRFDAIEALFRVEQFLISHNVDKNLIDHFDRVYLPSRIERVFCQIVRDGTNFNEFIGLFLDAKIENILINNDVPALSVAIKCKLITYSPRFLFFLLKLIDFIRNNSWTNLNEKTKVH